MVMARGGGELERYVNKYLQTMHLLNGNHKRSKYKTSCMKCSVKTHSYKYKLI